MVLRNGWLIVGRQFGWPVGDAIPGMIGAAGVSCGQRFVWAWIREGHPWRVRSRFGLSILCIALCRVCVPDEFNVLINPSHTDSRKFLHDPRLTK